MYCITVTAQLWNFWHIECVTADADVIHSPTVCIYHIHTLSVQYIIATRYSETLLRCHHIMVFSCVRH
jgi:hypothetical protein